MGCTGSKNGPVDDPHGNNGAKLQNTPQNASRSKSSSKHNSESSPKYRWVKSPTIMKAEGGMTESSLVGKSRRDEDSLVTDEGRDRFSASIVHTPNMDVTPTPTPATSDKVTTPSQPIPTSALASLDPSQMQKMLYLFNQSTMENHDPRVHKVKRSFNSLKQHYDVEDKTLGSGISGDVRLGRGKVTRRKVAIKTLNLKNNIDDTTRLRLLNEIFIYLSVDHPNIVRLYDVYIGKDEINLVMEYAEGGELYKNLLSRKSYCERDAAGLVYQMLSALVYLHSESICHRDLKLENWVYATKDPDSQLRLIDFGFARIFNETNPMRAPLGSIYYVSPEILSMKPYCEKTDMWSLGVIVYMMLSGRPPFSADKDFQTLSLIKKAKVEFTASVWERISEDAKDFVRKLLVKTPNDRMSAQDAINHPWIVKNTTVMESNTFGDEPSEGRFNQEDIQSIVHRMRDYTLRTEAYRHAANYIAKRAPNKLLSHIDQEFRRFDTSGTGVIEREDWMSVMHKLGVEEEEANGLFNSIDVQQDGVIRYSAFIASVNCVRTTPDGFIRASFERLSIDPTRRDYLLEDDLVRRFGEENGAQIFKEISACKVENSDIEMKGNRISFEQFRLFMQTGGIIEDESAMEDSTKREQDDDSVDMDAARDKQFCWENLAQVVRSVGDDVGDFCRDDPLFAEPPLHPSGRVRPVPDLIDLPTFHLARGQSI